MKRTLTICDCCGEEIDGMAYSLVAIRQDVLAKMPKKQREALTMLFEDVHEDCLPAIRALFSDEPVKRKNIGRSVTVDHDKIIALRAAGWSIPQIAKEVKCGHSTVSRVLQDAREAAQG